MDEDLRIEKVQAMVRSWAPRDQQERDQRKRFEEQLRQLMKRIDVDPHADHHDDLQITGSAVVLSEEGTLLHPQEFLPTWVAPSGHVQDHEYPWETAQREALTKTGVDARHPKEGPRIVGVSIQENAAGRKQLDLRFLLFANTDAAPSKDAEHDAKWFGDEEAHEAADESYKHALKLAHALRKAALK